MAVVEYRNEVISLDWDAYRAAPGMNPSWLVLGLKSMKHFLNAETDEKPDRGSVVGSSAHTLVFEPDKFYDRFAVYDGARRAGKKYTEFLKANEGKEILKQSEHAVASAIAGAVLNDPLAAELLGRGAAEVSVFCELNGVQCKGRIDALGPGVLVDLKTTTNVEMHAFGRVFANLRYAEKLACYRAFCRKLGIVVDEVYVIAVENKRPYDVTVIPIPEIVLGQAWERMERVLERVKQCLVTDNWPGVAEGGMYELHVPNWSMAAEEDVLDWSEG